MKTTNQELGQWGEDIAIDFLRQQGYVILERNWRHKKGEIDIIAKKGDLLTFIEVKTRSSAVFGEPDEFVTVKQQAKIIRTAMFFIDQLQHEGEIQFDIISIVKNADTNYLIKHIEDAFFPGLG